MTNFVKKNYSRKLKFLSIKSTIRKLRMEKITFLDEAVFVLENGANSTLAFSSTISPEAGVEGYISQVSVFIFTKIKTS